MNISTAKLHNYYLDSILNSVVTRAITPIQFLQINQRSGNSWQQVLTTQRWFCEINKFTSYNLLNSMTTGAIDHDVEIAVKLTCP